MPTQSAGTSGGQAHAASSWENGPWSDEDWKIWEASAYGGSGNEPDDAGNKSFEECAHTAPKVPEPKAMPVQPKQPRIVLPPEAPHEPRRPQVVPSPRVPVPPADPPRAGVPEPAADPPRARVPEPPADPPPGHIIAQQWAGMNVNDDDTEDMGFEEVRTDAFAEVMHRLGSWGRPASM